MENIDYCDLLNRPEVVFHSTPFLYHPVRTGSCAVSYSRISIRGPRSRPEMEDTNHAGCMGLMSMPATLMLLYFLTAIVRFRGKTGTAGKELTRQVRWPRFPYRCPDPRHGIRAHHVSGQHEYGSDTPPERACGRYLNGRSPSRSELERQQNIYNFAHRLHDQKLDENGHRHEATHIV